MCPPHSAAPCWDTFILSWGSQGPRPASRNEWTGLAWEVMSRNKSYLVHVSSVNWLIPTISGGLFPLGVRLYQFCGAPCQALYRAINTFWFSQIITLTGLRSAQCGKRLLMWLLISSFLRSASRDGAPKHMVSDKGVQFFNNMFESVMAAVGSVHRLTRAYQSQTNQT